MNGTIRIRSVAWFATAVVLTLVCSLLVTQAWSVGAAPGDSDSTFVPTAGCRLVDTRPAPLTVGPRNTPLVANDTMEVTVHGANGQCTGGLAIPTDAVGVALNVTAVNATTSSNIRVFPADLTTVPLLSNLNVVAGAPPTPNKVDVKLSPDGKIKVYNFNGSVDVILDLVGYYTDSSLKELATGVADLEARLTAAESEIAAMPETHWVVVDGNFPGTIVRQSGDIVLSRSGLAYFLTFPRDITDCAWVASLGGWSFVDSVLPILQNRGISTNLKLGDPAAIGVSVYDQTNVNVDNAFTLHVTCP